MIIAAVAFWLVVGAAVVFIAIRGGPGGAREALHTETVIGRRIRTALIALVFVLGIGVPVLVEVLNGEH
jgi:hypothetical protein